METTEVHSHPDANMMNSGIYIHYSVKVILKFKIKATKSGEWNFNLIMACKFNLVYK